MSWILAVLGGFALGGLALLDAHWGNPGVPVWAMPISGLALCVMLAVFAE